MFSRHFYLPIRAQSDYTSRRLRSQKALFQDMEVLLDFKSNPNSKTLYVRIKDNLKATKALRAYVGGFAAEVEVSLSKVTT